MALHRGNPMGSSHRRVKAKANTVATPRKVDLPEVLMVDTSLHSSNSIRHM
jgi:hypothetical protein